MIEEKFLPLGSVVLLKNGQKEIMIIGYAVQKEKIYDYCGCLYPEGLLSSNQTILFDHEEIQKLCFKGYTTQEQEVINKKLKELLFKNEA